MCLDALETKRKFLSKVHQFLFHLSLFLFLEEPSSGSRSCSAGAGGGEGTGGEGVIMSGGRDLTRVSHRRANALTPSYLSD